MNKNLTKKKLFPIIGVIIFLIAFPVMFIISKDIISRICLGFMLAFILWAYRTGFMQIYKCTDDISGATELIRGEGTENKNLWAIIREKDDLFQYDYLKYSFESFKKEMNRLESSKEVSYKCDIADYINIDDIEDSSNREYLDLVGAMLTGLGILGTFIGLTFGLQNFDSSSASAMASTIPALIEGIKIAFFTSIDGVALSLVFNLIHKNSLTKLNEALDKFYEEFYANVVPLPDNELANQMLKYQQEQSSAMVQFAETISVKIAESFEKVALPTFNNINTTMNMLSEKMVENQTEGLNTIVNEFISQMNSSLNGQFLELGKTLESMNAWEKNMIGEIQRIVEELMNSSENITGVNVKLGEIMDNLSSFSQELNGFLIGVNNAYESMDKQRNIFDISLKNQEQVLYGLQGHEGILISKFDEINSRINDILKTAEGQVHLNNEITEALNSKLNNSAEVLKEVSEAFNKDIESSARSLGTVTEAFNEEIRKSAEGMKDITDGFQEGIKDTASTMKSIAQDFNSEISGTANILKSSGEEFIARLDGYFGQLEQAASGTLSAFNGGIEAAAGKMEDLIKAFNDYMLKSAGEIAGMGGSFKQEIGDSALMLQGVFKGLNEELGKSSEELAGICEKFNDTVKKSVEVSNEITETFKKDVNYSVRKTFEVFDTSLGEISIHLSGTIKEIQETVDKLPMIENEYLDKIKRQYDGYVEELAKVHRDIKHLVKELLEETAEVNRSTGKKEQFKVQSIPDDFSPTFSIDEAGDN